MIIACGQQPFAPFALFPWLSRVLPVSDDHWIRYVYRKLSVTLQFVTTKREPGLGQAGVFFVQRLRRKI